LPHIIKNINAKLRSSIDDEVLQSLPIEKLIQNIALLCT